MKASKHFKGKKTGVSYCMMAPWMLLFLLFTILPVFAAVGLSFTDFNLLESPEWIGLSNYFRLFLEDDVFIIALKNTLILAVITGPVGYILSFVIAWMINDLSRRASSFLTLLFYVPTMAGNVYFIWKFIFSGDSYGLLNSLLMRIGIITEPIYWLTDSKINLYACIIVVLWMSMGAGFLAMIAGFKGLNISLFEAGALDGIRNRWQELWYITLPQMVPQLLIGAVLSISSAFAVGYQCKELTGFPSTDYSTHTVVLHILDYSNNRYEMGYACAISVVLFIIMVVAWRFIDGKLRKFGAD